MIGYEITNATDNVFFDPKDFARQEDLLQGFHVFFLQGDQVFLL